MRHKPAKSFFLPNAKTVKGTTADKVSWILQSWAFAIEAKISHFKLVIMLKTDVLART